MSNKRLVLDYATRQFSQLQATSCFIVLLEAIKRRCKNGSKTNDKRSAINTMTKPEV